MGADSVGETSPLLHAKDEEVGVKLDAPKQQHMAADGSAGEQQLQWGYICSWEWGGCSVLNCMCTSNTLQMHVQNVAHSDSAPPTYACQWLTHSDSAPPPHPACTGPDRKCVCRAEVFGLLSLVLGCCSPLTCGLSYLVVCDILTFFGLTLWWCWLPGALTPMCAPRRTTVW